MNTTTIHNQPGTRRMAGPCRANKTPGTASKGSDATRVCLVAATAEPCTGDRREAEWKRPTRLLENCRGPCHPGGGCSLLP